MALDGNAFVGARAREQALAARGAAQHAGRRDARVDAHYALHVEVATHLPSADGTRVSPTANVNRLNSHDISFEPRTQRVV